MYMFPVILGEYIGEIWFVSFDSITHQLLMKTERNQAKRVHRRLIICWLISSAWALVCYGIYSIASQSYAPLTGLDQFWCQWRHIFRYVTSTWTPCFQLYFTFILAIGTSGESSKGTCDRLIHRVERSWLNDPPWVWQFEVFGNVGR